MEEWEGELEQPLYLALASVACHLIGQLKAGETDNFPAAFYVVEQWHLQSDSYVREAASVGVLEDLAKHEPSRGHGTCGLPAVAAAQSKRWLAKVEGFWSGGELLRKRVAPRGDHARCGS